MTYILSADWHAHNWSQFATTDESGVNSRLGDIANMIEYQARVARANGATRIFVAGDIFHVRGSIKPTVFNSVAQTLRMAVEEYGVRFVLMPGNHDLEGVESEELSSAITALGNIPGVTVIDEPTVFHDEQVYMVPWFNTRDGLATAIDCFGAGPRADYDLILHTGINGVLVGMPDHGWGPNELAAFGFGRVFAGHYHHHKAFDARGDGNGCKVVSIGALTHQTWSDVNTDAGFLVVEPDRFTFEESLAPKFMDFTGYDEGIKGNFVRVRGVEMTEEEIRTLREKLHEAGAAGVVIDPLIKRDATRESVDASEESVTLEAQIAAYAKENGGKIAGEIEREALDILQEVRSAE